MELKAKLVKLLPEQRGQGKNGEWVKREFVCSYGDEFPKEICFSLWGDKVHMLNGIQPGSEVNVKFNVESRPHEGRYFSECKAWFVVLTSASQAPVAPAPAQPPVFAAPPAQQPTTETKYDLPF